jgi:hypothetical protein
VAYLVASDSQREAFWALFGQRPDDNVGPARYPPHQGNVVNPAPAPPASVVSAGVDPEESQYVSLNILCTKNLPEKYSKECAKNFGSEIQELVDKVYVVYIGVC